MPTLIKANKYDISPRVIYCGTRGSHGFEKLSFSFSDDWNGLAKKVVFIPQRGRSVEIPLISDTTEISVPPEVTAYAGKSKFILSGRLVNGSQIDKKIISLTGEIDVDSTAADDGCGNTNEITADTYDLFLEEALAAVNDAIYNAINSGEDCLDGVSPTVSVASITGGHRVTITDVDGVNTFDVMNGVNGEDGTSPAVSVTSITGGHRVTITDASGVNTFDVLNGVGGSGDGGSGGVSPTVSVANISGGHRLTITDVDGSNTFNVMDGTNGSDGLSPTVSVTSITGGHMVQITSSAGTASFNVMDGTNGSDASITIDSAMSATSPNAVQNKIIKEYVDGLIGDINSAINSINGIIGGGA